MKNYIYIIFVIDGIHQVMEIFMIALKIQDYCKSLLIV